MDCNHPDYFSPATMSLSLHRKNVNCIRVLLQRRCSSIELVQSTRSENSNHKVNSWTKNTLKIQTPEITYY